MTSVMSNRGPALAQATPVRPAGLVRDGRPRAWYLAAALIPLALGLCGCRLIAMPWVLFGPEHKRDIPAEYKELEKRKVAIFVWADQDTSWQFRNVALEVSAHVEASLKAHVRGITVVPPRDTVDYQNRNAEWAAMQPAALGARFGADRTLMIELTQYTAREPEAPQLARAYVSANVKVYDAKASSEPAAYRTEVSVKHPPNAPAAWGVSENTIRREAMELFAEELVNRFYDRTVTER
jgi:hypothetical protein